MKKLLAFIFVATVAASCTKKETSYQQDSNIMLAEPEVKVVDSAAVTEPVDNTTAPTPNADTTAAKLDSVR